ncbi:MAG: hypothetical protein JWM10_3215 [Myxococcaceae bacterium]|nr:hypothetical protein [Myxococcaceae bacterium]
MWPFRKVAATGPVSSLSTRRLLVEPLAAPRWGDRRRSGPGRNVAVVEDRAPPRGPLSAGSIARPMALGQRATRGIAAAVRLPFAVLATCGFAASSCDLPPPRRLAPLTPRRDPRPACSLRPRAPRVRPSDRSRPC